MLGSCQPISLNNLHNRDINMEDHEDQIIPPILYEQPGYYDWPIRAVIRDVNKLISRPLLKL